jgi:hypothetical protein
MAWFLQILPYLPELLQHLPNIPDAPWRVDSIREMGAISILHPQISPSLARLAGANSMVGDVLEQPQGKFIVSRDEKAIDGCNRWAKNMRSREFRDGLLRLLRHQEIGGEIDLTWLAKISITPTTNILTDLYLNNLQIARNVSGDYYCDREQFKIYLHCDDRDIMANYLTRALNNALGEKKLEDLSPLLSILDLPPETIAQKLDKLRIRQLDNMVELERDRSDPIVGDSIDTHYAQLEDIATESEDEDSTELVNSNFDSARDLIDRSEYLELVDEDKDRENLKQLVYERSNHFPEWEYIRYNRVVSSLKDNKPINQMEISFEPYSDKELRDNIDRAGIAKVIEYERQQGRFPQEKPHNNKGFDIISCNQDGEPIRTIEVKSKLGNWDSVIVSQAQFKTALERGDNFWLYVVERALDDDKYQIYTIQNPAHKVQKFVYKSFWQALAVNS